MSQSQDDHTPCLGHSALYSHPHSWLSQILEAISEFYTFLAEADEARKEWCKGTFATAAEAEAASVTATKVAVLTSWQGRKDSVVVSISSIAPFT